MGFTHDTQMSQFIPPAALTKTAGTWTDSVASNVVKSVRTAAGAATTVVVPVFIPSNGAAYKGSRLKSIDLYWTNGTADMTDVNTVELEKVTLNANGTAPSGAAVTGVTIDTNNDTNAKRLTQAAHAMTVTLDAPAWIDDAEAYYLTVIFNCAAGSVLTLWGARINFDMRN